MTHTANHQAVTQWIAERTSRVFGFRLAPTTQKDIISATALAIDHKQQLIIAHQNLHGLYMGMTNPAFSELHEQPQALIHIDGFPLVYIAWLHRLWHVRMSHRAAVHDWLPHFVEAAQKNNWRIFCLGSSPEVNAQAIKALKNIAPGAALSGRSGYFNATAGSADNQAVLADINAFNPNIVIVGMGMGRQEQWILDNMDALDGRCVVAVGACLEYMAGEMSICPRWFGPFGLEMLWRLISHPRRYAHRYLVEPWLLLTLLIKNGRLISRGDGDAA